MRDGMTLDDYLAVSATVVFDIHHFACDFCPLEETYSRKQCRMTGEYLIDGKGRGAFCPLEASLTPEQRDQIAKANYDYLENSNTKNGGKNR